MFRSNPMFSSVNTNYESISSDQATYGGITIKTLILLGIAGIVGIITGVSLDRIANVPAFYGFLFASIILEFIFVILGRSNPRYSAVCGVLYSICEGVLLGTITALVNTYYEGIAVLAVASTAIVFVVCLVMFSCGMMRDTSKLSRIAMVLLISMLLMFVVTLICSIFNIGGVQTLVKNNKAVLLLVEGVFLLYASIMLFFNFNEATFYVQSGATKEFEWTCAFGFLVSILYIYLEVLRILAIILDRN